MWGIHFKEIRILTHQTQDHRASRNTLKKLKYLFTNSEKWQVELRNLFAQARPN